MAQYYFLATLLPPLKYGEQNEFTQQDFKDLLNVNLDPKDRRQFEILLRFFDLINLRSFWKKQPLGFLGNWNELDLDKFSLDQEGVPLYLRDYLETYPHHEEQIKNFSTLLLRYYQNEIPNGTFINWWLKFEGGFRLNLAAVRALQMDKNLDDEPVFQGKENEEALAIKACVAAREFTPQAPFTQLRELYETYKEDPLDLMQAIDRFKFKAIEEFIAFDHFSIDYILGYAVLFYLNLKIALRDEKEVRAVSNKYLKEIF